MCVFSLYALRTAAFKTAGRQSVSPATPGNDTNNKEVPLMRVKDTLRCNECKQRNYNTMKNKKNTPGQARAQQVLPVLQEAHAPQRDQVKADHTEKGRVNYGRRSEEEPRSLVPRNEKRIEKSHWPQSKTVVKNTGTVLAVAPCSSARASGS